MLPGFNKKVKYYDGEVPAREAHSGLYIALIRYRDFDFSETEKYSGPELRVVNADGKHVGGTLTIHGPEVRYGGEIEPAEVNWSAIGSVNADITEATAELMMFASWVAREWTQARMPGLLKEKKQYEQEREESRREAKKRGLEMDARATKVRAFCGDKVRVTFAGSKQSVGTLVNDPNLAFNRKFVLENNYKPIEFSVSQIEKFEYKQGGRFQEVTL